MEPVPQDRDLVQAKEWAEEVVADAWAATNRDRDPAGIASARRAERLSSISAGSRAIKWNVRNVVPL